MDNAGKSSAAKWVMVLVVLAVVGVVAVYAFKNMSSLTSNGTGSADAGQPMDVPENEMSAAPPEPTAAHPAAAQLCTVTVVGNG